MTKPTGRPRGRPPKNSRPEDQKPADDDDLIGDSAPASEPPKKRGPGRPRKHPPPEEKPVVQDDGGAPLSFDVADVYGGVSTTWLAHVFGMDKNTVKKKLARGGCPVMARGQRNTPLYAIHEACAYLVKPKIDLVEHIKGLRPNDLPPILNDAYWGAMIKRQKWEENAKDLWRTDDVARVLGDVAFLYKTTSQLWVEELDRHHGLEPEMRETLIQLVDNLLERVHEELTALPNKQSTASSVAEEGVVPGSGERQEVSPSE